MPIYEFKCQGCGSEFEELCSSAEAASRMSCPSCACGEIQRMMSAFGFTSKGSGGETARSSSSGHACGNCSSHNCSHCH